MRCYCRCHPPRRDGRRLRWEQGQWRERHGGRGAVEVHRLGEEVVHAHRLAVVPAGLEAEAPVLEAAAASQRLGLRGRHAAAVGQLHTRRRVPEKGKSREGRGGHQRDYVDPQSQDWI